MSDEIEALIAGTASVSKPKQPIKSSASKVTDFDVNKSYGTPSKLLDNLRMTESSGNETIINPDTKAMGHYQFLPDTAATLHKQGIKFNVFDPKESRAAADYYIQKLVAQNGGDYNKAMAQYGGFKTKDPSQYVGKVMQGVNFDASAQPQVQQQTSVQPKAQVQGEEDEIGQLISGTYKAPARTTQTQSNLPAYKQVFNKLEAQNKNEPLALQKGIVSAADTLLGVIPAAVNTGEYAIARATGKAPEQAKQFAEKAAAPFENPIGRAFGITESPAYKNEALRTKVMPAISETIGSLIRLGNSPEEVSRKTGLPVQDVNNIVDSLSFAVAPEAAKVITKGVNKFAKAEPIVSTETGRETPSLQQQFEAKRGATQPTAVDQSVGAASSTHESQVLNAIQQASPELQQALKDVPVKDVNLPVLERHVEADSLPVPIKLTRGQATQDVALLSDEMNQRGKNPELAYRFNEQNGKLLENINAIRDKAAPDVYGTNHIENGQYIIDSYKNIDEARTNDISEKYKALKDAAGGEFPIDGKAFAENAFKNLRADLKTDFVPPAIERQLDRFKSGEPMTFEQFEAMRTNLAAEQRKAARASDGNTEYAVNVIRQSLEDLPLTGGAEALKPIADEARAAAKARFDLLKKDPAYKAAVTDSTHADDFINKYVINGKKQNLQAMTDQLGYGSPAHQAMSAGTINWLKGKAGIVNDNGNFTQAGYNKALENIRPKLQELVDAETAKHLETLGSVARYTQAQPRGSFVNQSNTFTANLRQGAAGLAERTANVALGANVIPVGTYAREIVEKQGVKKATKKALEPAAGVKHKLSDIGKEQK